MSYDAFSFRSRHDLSSMRRTLADDGTASWRGGDSETWGEYLVARSAETGTRLRIFVDGDRFVVDMTTTSAAALENARELVSTRLLPAVETAEVTPHGGWE